MKVLITGINGFVGSILRRSLEQRGLEVFGMDVQSHDTKVHAVDITNNPEVAKCVLETAPDFIYHLAAISQVDFSNIAGLYAINVNGTINLLSASARLDRKPKFLYISSSQVYGIVDDGRQPIAEDAEVRPVNHYGASKAASEQIALAFHAAHDIPVAIVRPFNHIGRGQNPHFVIPKIIKTVKEKKPEIELGNLSVIRDFLDVRDVIDIYIKLMENFPDGGIFNVASGTGYRLSDLVTLIQETAGARLQIKNVESLLRKNEILKMVGDNSLIKKQYGWQPRYGIKETFEWMLTE